MIDMVVHRHDLPETIARICGILTKTPVGIPDPEELAADIAAADGATDEMPSTTETAKDEAAAEKAS
jgi:acetyl-CoA carboxylase carboxyl transferase subunit beta